MKPTVEQISNLLAHKDTERPDAVYWQNFICEFHKNQREQSVKLSACRRLIGGVSNWFSDLGATKWAYGAGVAYAAVTIAFFLTPRDAALWEDAKPFLDVRNNDEHTLVAYAVAQQLLKLMARSIPRILHYNHNNVMRLYQTILIQVAASNCFNLRCKF